MKKTEVKMNKPVYLGQAILDISKTLMYEFWYDYIKPKYGDKARLCYMDTDSFIMYIKTADFYKDIGVMMQINGLTLLTMIKMIIGLQKLEKTKRLSVNLKMNQMEKS